MPRNLKRKPPAARPAPLDLLGPSFGPPRPTGAPARGRRWPAAARRRGRPKARVPLDYPTVQPRVSVRGPEARAPPKAASARHPEFGAIQSTSSGLGSYLGHTCQCQCPG
jgi:hypothetical protein